MCAVVELVAVALDAVCTTTAAVTVAIAIVHICCRGLNNCNRVLGSIILYF